MIICRIKRNVAEVVEQGVVHQCPEEAKLVEGHSIVLDSIHFHHPVALRNRRISASIVVTHVAYSIAECMLMEQYIILPPTDAKTGRNAPEVSRFLYVAHSIEFSIHAVDIVIA